MTSLTFIVRNSTELTGPGFPQTYQRNFKDTSTFCTQPSSFFFENLKFRQGRPVFHSLPRVWYVSYTTGQYWTSRNHGWHLFIFPRTCLVPDLSVSCLTLWHTHNTQPHTVTHSGTVPQLPTPLLCVASSSSEMWESKPLHPHVTTKTYRRDIQTMSLSLYPPDRYDHVLSLHSLLFPLSPRNVQKDNLNDENTTVWCPKTQTDVKRRTVISPLPHLLCSLYYIYSISSCGHRLVLVVVLLGYPFLDPPRRVTSIPQIPSFYPNVHIFHTW